MALDSKAAFPERGLEFGISQASLDALEAGGIASFAPVSTSRACLGARPGAAEAAAYRMLFFFSHALALQDLEGRLDEE